MGLRSLFNSDLSFTTIEAGMSDPLVAYYSNKASKYLRYRAVAELYCHSQILCKKYKNVESIDWREINASKLVQGTKYPNQQY